MSARQRKRHWIDRAVQGALVWQMLRQWLILAAVLFAVCFGIEYLFAQSGQTIGGMFAAVWTKHGLTFVLLGLLLPPFAYDVVKSSHRFAGPVWRVRGELRRLADGDCVEPIKLRKRDFWHDLADAFNDVLRRVERSEALPVEPIDPVTQRLLEDEECHTPVRV